MEASSLLTGQLPLVQPSHPGGMPLLEESERLQEEPSSDVERLVDEQIDAAIAPIPSSVKGAKTAQVGDQETAAQFWKVFGSTFLTIFLAELGDKTQVATLLMTAESHAPWVVFTGAALALMTTSLLGVLVGHWLASRISPKTLDTAAGITLALISAWLLFDVVSM